MLVHIRMNLALGSELLSSYAERQVKKSRKSGKEAKEEAKEEEELDCSTCGHVWSWTRSIKIVRAVFVN